MTVGRRAFQETLMAGGTTSPGEEKINKENDSA
jgi:hypothetical protein